MRTTKKFDSDELRSINAAMIIGAAERLHLINDGNVTAGFSMPDGTNISAPARAIVKTSDLLLKEADFDNRHYIHLLKTTGAVGWRIGDIDPLAVYSGSTNKLQVYLTNQMPTKDQVVAIGRAIKIAARLGVHELFFNIFDENLGYEGVIGASYDPIKLEKNLDLLAIFGRLESDIKKFNIGLEQKREDLGKEQGMMWARIIRRVAPQAKVQGIY